MANPYDVVRYPNWPVAETHPASLGALAALFGRPPAPFANCRVLEVGCGEAVNLMSLAVGAPASAFVGIDLAEAPIALGRNLARAAGLDNVSLFARDITEGGAGLGGFDYIIAHGVYAWVPPAVRGALLRLAAERLTADGLLYISYNALPGCHLREALRDPMRDAVRHIDDPAQKIDVARKTLGRFIELWSEDDPFQKALIVEAREALKHPPALLYHDELGDIYAPQLLGDVVAAARAEGLEYLCDAKAKHSAEALFPSGRDLGQSRADWARFEQAMDFSEMRRFRRSIFCRAGAVDRQLRPERLKNLWASADLTRLEADPGQSDGFVFRAHNGAEIVTHDESFAALMTQLGDAWPQSIPLHEIASDPDTADSLLRLFVAKIVSLQTAPLRFAASPGERPLASPLARAQAAQGEEYLASLRHRPVHMADSGARRFITLMDGARTRKQLAEIMSKESGLAPVQALARTLAAVGEMARLGLVVA